MIPANGEYVLEDEHGSRNLVVTGQWSEAATEALERGEADGLVLNYARGFIGADIEFLDERLALRRLDLLVRGIADLSPVARLSGSLEQLSLQVADGAELDLAELPRLSTVAGGWSVLAATLSSVGRLRSVITWRFDEADLHAFRDHVALERLTIKEAPLLESMSGVGELPDLSVLEVVLAHRLSDITDVAGLVSPLREFKLEACSAIESIDDIAQLVNLRRLGLSDCGDIESLAPIGALAQLEEFYAWGSTRILDGDLSPLLHLSRLREIRMRERRSYSPRVAEIVAARSA